MQLEPLVAWLIGLHRRGWAVNALTEQVGIQISIEIINCRLANLS